MRRPRTRRHPPWIFRLFGLLPLVGGCSSAVEPLLTRWEGDLVPILPSTVSGLVAAVTHFGRTDISILIERGEAGLTYGWRVESGTCEGSGAIQGGRAVYPDLVASEAGTAGGETSIAALFKADFQLAARVVRSVDGAEQVVACGDLQLIQ